jgi:GMP synthase-like glutamine amidotransferase
VARAHILFENSIRKPEARAGFDLSAAPRIAEQGPQGPATYAIHHMCEQEPVSDSTEFTHLILSGSELSAARANPWDDDLCALIESFAVTGRPILGICYGHQMIPRALVGPGRCRRAVVPEFGWKSLDFVPNPLFAGVEELVAVHSHYDELFDLPSEFEVIASTKDCGVQAFQVRERPIWGVQFHPEQSFEDGERMLAENLETEPRARELFVNDLRDPARVAGNMRIFENFLSTTGG